MSLAVNSGDPTRALIADRYRVELELARGGMGVVYVAFDTALQRKVALKRLNVTSDVRRRTRMFEREYRALAALKHPRIIEVYDYGVDERGAYYTMELLDGRDLHELAPLPYPIACRYLRDVASSLALLHARNLLHRDLSPRNVRITSDNRAKLIDFGTLCGFGKSATVAGTAPCVPPEALYGNALDQRTDLYALGALGYWLLTGLHAFDVSSLDELPAAWNRPIPSTSSLAPKDPEHPQIPKALDELVMALLSRNPLARPGSAAEVIARLSAIAKLAPDDEPLSALSYLHGGRTVGHERERDQLRKRLSTAAAGSGSVVTLEAAPGMRSKHIFSDLASEARLLNVTAIVIDASEHRGPYAVVACIVRELLALHPQKTRAAMGPDAALLARFAANSTNTTGTQRLSAVTDAGADPREARLRTQAALLAFVQRLSKELPLLVAVHNLERADDSSLTLLSGLAHGIASRRMLLALAYDPQKLDAATTPALASLSERAIRLRLCGLNRDEVRALVEEAFGEVQHRERLATWLHQLTGGNPQSCLDLMHYLLERGVIRFVDGVWTLPRELHGDELPKDLGQALNARIEVLSTGALRLASALAVHRGPMPLERWEAIALMEQIAEPLRILAELEQSGVLLANDEVVRFSHSKLRDAVLQRLAPEERQELHAQLGAQLARESSPDLGDMLDTGWHLLHAGQETDGAELLAHVGFALSSDGDRLAEVIPALEAALTVFRKQRRPKHELAHMLGMLTYAGFYADRKTMETYGDEAAALLQDVLGLRLCNRLRPWLGARASLFLGLGRGFIGFVLALGPREGNAAFRRTIDLYGAVTTTLTALATLTLDAPRAQRCANMLEPLAALGPDHMPAIAGKLVSALALLPRDQIAQSLAGCREVVARLESGKPIHALPEKSALLIHGGALYALGSLETFRENPEALRIADRLESMGVKLFELFANQIRANYHGLRGETPLAERYRRRVELFAVQAGSGWQAEVWAPPSEIIQCQLSGDVIGLRRVAGEVERLSKEIPSLAPYARMAIAVYHSARGDHAMALELSRQLVTESEPRAFTGWAVAISARISDLAACGQLQQALELGRGVLDLYDAEDRKVTTMITLAIIELALVEAELGDVIGAAARIDDYLTEIGEGGGPATRGRLHEARVQIAQRAGDLLTARAHLIHMEQCYRPTENPALIARYELLHQELEAGADDLSGQRTTRLSGLPDVQQIQKVLRGCESQQQRYDRALDLLLEHTGGKAGYLFSYEDSELTLVAPRLEESPSSELRARLREEITRQPVTDATTLVTGPDDKTTTEAARRPEPADGHRSFVLRLKRDKGVSQVVAAAAIARGASPLRGPSLQLLTELAEGLAAPLATPSPAGVGRARGQS